jgi:membrane-bound lytic murein transglycosylase D
MHTIHRFFLFVFVVLATNTAFSQKMPDKISALGISFYLDNETKIVMRSEIEKLNANRKYLDNMLGKMALYFPYIERELAEENVPDDFKYLTVQESALIGDAVSTSNAVGFWQFKFDTALEVGMMINDQIDERKHIASATRGAAISLSRNNLILKSWASTLLAHRLGLNGARNRIPIEWANANSINVSRDTDWYIIRFLAHKYVLEREYTMFAKGSEVLYEYKLGRGKSLRELSEELRISEEDIRKHNLWINSDRIPDNKDFSVFILTKPSVSQVLDTKILNQQNNINLGYETGFPELEQITTDAIEGEPVYFRINGVKGILAINGDTPETIAERGDVKLKKFLKYNDLDNEAVRIVPGKVYYLKKKPDRAKVVYHIVRNNETLWEIAHAYGISLSSLLDKNRIDNPVQRLGKGRLMWLMETRPDNVGVEYVKNQEPTKKPKEEERTVLVRTEPTPIVTIPQAVEPSPSEVIVKPEPPTVVVVEQPQPVIEQPQPVIVAESKQHTVSHGETFFSISQKYKLSVPELKKLNNLGSKATLLSGQVLKVSKQSTASNLTPQPIELITPAPSETVIVETKPSESTSETTTTVVRGDETPSVPTPKSEGKTIYHTVKNGETAFRVSVIHKVSVDDIARWNKLKGYSVYVGQRLMIRK